jgi:ABC-type sugar transport systems, ATPase components
MTRRQETFDELRLTEICRHFGDIAAVNKVSLSVRRGEFVALLGPSGCGKSTALGCVAGLIPLTSGEIRLDDARIDTLPTERRDFGMVFQNYALFPHLTVARNVAFGLEVRGEKRAVVAERVEWALSSGAAFRLRRTPIRRSCPAASSSASPSHGHSRRTRASC